MGQEVGSRRTCPAHFPTTSDRLPDVSSHSAGPRLAIPRQLLLDALAGREWALLRLRGPETWQPVTPGGPFLTTVVRLPFELADRLYGELGALRRATPNHYHYAATSLHVTLLNLDSLRAPDEALDEAADRMAPILARVMAAAPTVRLTVRGLVVGRHSLFAGAADDHSPGTLAQLRRGLWHSLRPVASAKRHAHLGDDLGFINLVRYGNEELTQLRRLASRMRHHGFGSFRVETVELVCTDKVLSGAGTRVLSALPFGATGR